MCILHTFEHALHKQGLDFGRELDEGEFAADFGRDGDLVMVFIARRRCRSIRGLLSLVGLSLFCAASSFSAILAEHDMAADQLPSLRICLFHVC